MTEKRFSDEQTKKMPIKAFPLSLAIAAEDFLTLGTSSIDEITQNMLSAKYING